VLNLIRALSVVVMVSSLAACSPASNTSLDALAETPVPVASKVLVAGQSLIGTAKAVTISSAEGGLCSGDSVRVELIQPAAKSAAEFYEVATENVITMLTAVKAESSYEGFGFIYSASAEGLVDGYGNVSTDEILWNCYSSGDVSSINLSNVEFLRANVLDMNGIGQDDVATTYVR
jgi:hypothetical protein